MAKWRRVRIPIPEDLGPAMREAIGIAIRNKIQDNTQSGVGVNSSGTRRKRFPGYTPEYAKKKGQSNVDLTLSAEMLAAMNLISHKKGSVLIGFPNGTDQNGKAEGNITGSYGRPFPDSTKARNFLGMVKSEVATIVKSEVKSG